MKNLRIKLSLIIVGILIMVLGLFLSLSIILYSGKEQDSSGYYYLVISLPILIFGISILRNGIIRKRKLRE